VLSDPKMYSLPGHGLAEFHHPRCHTSNGAFVCMRYGIAMEVNAEREIETTLRQGVYIRF
jgi:hypothetical protein